MSSARAVLGIESSRSTRSLYALTTASLGAASPASAESCAASSAALACASRALSAVTAVIRRMPCATAVSPTIANAPASAVHRRWVPPQNSTLTP